MHVIVTDCHQRISLALIRELSRAGHEVTAVSEAGRSPLGLRCRQAAQTRLFPGGLSEHEYAERLLDLCAERPDSTLLPAGARTVGTLARRQAEFKTVARFLVPAPEVLETSGDKHRVARLASSLGIPVPRPLSFETADPVDKLAGTLTYPLVLKYRNGEKLGLSAERRYAIVHTPREFARRYETMHDVQPPVIVQEYIPGGGLGVSLLLDAEHRPVRVFCHKRTREYPTSGGPSTACRSDWFPVLIPLAVTLLSALRFVGFAMVEFKGSPQDARLLEINPRLWGSYPLAALSGAGMADAYVKAVYGAEPPRKLTCSYQKGAKMQYFLNDCLAGLGYLGRGRPDQTLRVLLDALSPKVKGGVFSGSDLRGSFYYLRSFFMRGK